MKKERRHPKLPLAKTEVGNMHFRLCHLCAYLNEGDAEIESCRHCAHTFKDESLIQFFDNNDDEAFSDQLEEPKRTKSDEVDDGSGRMSPRRSAVGVYGLSVVF